jgi:hypothetical protein
MDLIDIEVEFDMLYEFPFLEGGDDALKLGMFIEDVGDDRNEVGNQV